jgi:hypothetical protein
MTFPRLLPRFRTVAALATLVPCVGCWEEVHYEPPPETAAPDAAVEGGDPTADPDDTSAETTPVVPAPSGEELFAGDPPQTNDPGAEAPVGVDPTPIVVDRPALVTVDDPTPPPAVAAPTAAERRAAWTLASNWSLVATLHTRDLDPDQFKKYLAAARAAREAGDSLGIAAPRLPTGDTREKLVAATIADLKTDAGPKLADAVSARFDDATGAMARLAIRANLLLLTYTPAGSTVWGDAADIRDAGVASGLPPELWRPLVEQLEQRSDYLHVMQAVLALRNGVADHLAE